MDMPSGTQSLIRGIKLLRVLATRGELGWRLSDLAAACNLDKGTAHRMLSALVEERLVQQRTGDRRYLPGPLLYELGLSLPGQHDFQAAAEVHLAALARRMRGTTLLLMRSGNEYVCSVRAGPSRVPGLMVEKGTRRPLFTSVGGVAILQTLSADEAEDVLRNNVDQEVAKRGDARLAALEKMRKRSARHGFGINLGDIVGGLHAFAVPVHGPDGKGFSALCLVGTSEGFPEEQLAVIHEELENVARILEADAAHMLFTHQRGEA
ncbi:IclR family transcriptional regulator [Ramlibacter sp. WS9]|uniref:IclR family transcriptional regulator n=1 Tax=Ramlibacter sp. WS9 TaxID=1882741 RepID=UPI0011426C79|nr:IclR family transcriptional regulator [Ramlibacter sp. WS9]ROZ68775.1 IclR family transcriptional regulator [Ramlibacter sp. WS9]